MAKKKKAPVLEAWCWYCDRDFEDDKVLLQHQRAKHYKCPQCPRRLNTAGGLTVHLHQVHKAEPGRIENALPGRDSFDMEIYGMAGIPEADLAEWQARKARGNNSNSSNGPPPSKKPKVESVALTPEQLKAQLEAHKALMNGGSSNSNPEASTSSNPSASIPPPGFNPGVPGAPSGPSQRGPYPQPPSNVGYGGYNQPPPLQYNAPPPGFGMPPRPGFHAGPPPSNPAFGGYPNGPPPSLPQNPVYGNGYAPPPYQGGPRQWGAPPAIPNPNGPLYSGPPPPIPQPQYSPHQIAVRTGAKSRMVYTDKEISPEEKLASMGKYRYIDPDDAPLNSVQPQASNHPSYQGPPPSSNPSQSDQSAPGYGGPPPTNMWWPQRQSSSSSASPAPPNSSFPPQGSPQTQSYPAIAPGALPPSAQPQANTAEALAQANANASETSSMNGNGAANGNGIQEREAEVRQMVEGAKDEENKGDVQSAGQNSGVEGGSTGEGESTATRGRKRAADLF